MHFEVESTRENTINNCKCTWHALLFRGQLLPGFRKLIMELANNAKKTVMPPRPRTILRASAVGECVAMLMFVQAVFTFGAWIAAAPLTLTPWLILPSSLWVVLRSVGYGSGRVATFTGTVCAIFLAWLAAGSTDASLPNWLTRGPLSPWATAVVLVAILIIDLCDIPWSRGLSWQETRVAVRRFLLRFWGWGLGALFVVYMIIIPGVDAILDQFGEPEPTSVVLEDLTFAEAVLLRATEAFTAVWFFILGATVGSFLNVVVYRTPRGESLIRNASACPKCGTPIAGRDNIPILGWLWLKGRCRACQLSISARYPIVEALVGTIFLVFLFAELLSGGINLPERTPNTYAGVVWIIFYTKWDLIGHYLFHCLLLTALLTWSLISYDGQRVPVRLIGTTFAIAVVPVMIWPGLSLVSWGPDGLWKPTMSDSLTAVGFGTIAGLISGWGVSFLLNWKRKQSYPPMDREFLAGTSLVGAMLGWQAGLSVVALALLVRLAQLSLLGRSSSTLFRNWPLTGSLLIATVIQLLTWRLLATHLSGWWPVLGVSVSALATWGIFTIALITAIRLIRIRNQDRSSCGLEEDRTAVANRS